MAWSGRNVSPAHVASRLRPTLPSVQNAKPSSSKLMSTAKRQERKAISSRFPYATLLLDLMHIHDARIKPRFQTRLPSGIPRLWAHYLKARQSAQRALKALGLPPDE